MWSKLPQHAVEIIRALPRILHHSMCRALIHACVNTMDAALLVARIRTQTCGEVTNVSTVLWGAYDRRSLIGRTSSADTAEVTAPLCLEVTASLCLEATASLCLEVTASLCLHAPDTCAHQTDHTAMLTLAAPAYATPLPLIRTAHDVIDSWQDCDVRRLHHCRAICLLVQRIGTPPG